MRAFLPIVAITLALSTTPALAADQPRMFNTEQEAQAHCPKDVVAWLNIPTGVMHYKGQHWYGMTKNGAYVCQGEAIKAGDRGTRNGQ